MSELIGAMRAALADAETPRTRLSQFGVAFRPGSGPLAGQILTVFRAGRDPEIQEMLARRHESYLDCLRLAGIRVPPTEFRLLDRTGSQRPVIVQAAIDRDMMLPALLRKAGPDTALGLLDRVASDVAEFWRRVAQRPERIGLHARIEHFAMDEQGPLFLETFPPLISYDRDEIGHLIQRFADSGLVRGMGKILPGRLRDMQDRWYTPAGSVATLIDGALRIRPQDHEAILDWAGSFADRRLERKWRKIVHGVLARQMRRFETGQRRWGGLAVGRPRPHA